MFKQLGLIGCGLMGGSFALALKRHGLVGRVVGYSPSPSTTARARQLGVIDAEAASAADAASGCDLVLLAVPVAATGATLSAIREQVAPDTLLMDVGSTKQDVVEAARTALGDRIGAFVPCHPIAGKEVGGIEHARADLYADQQLIITPTEQTAPRQLQQAQALWEALGARVRRMAPDAHDAALAAVSHLPHLVAFAAIHAISAQPRGAEFLSLGGPGFRDFTRIAAGEPPVWRDILLANREEVLAQSRLMRDSLARFEQRMQAGDAAGLEELIREVSAVRAAWRMGSR